MERTIRVTYPVFIIVIGLNPHDKPSNQTLTKDPQKGRPSKTLNTRTFLKSERLSSDGELFCFLIFWR